MSKKNQASAAHAKKKSAAPRKTKTAKAGVQPPVPIAPGEQKPPVKVVKPDARPRSRGEIAQGKPASPEGAKKEAKVYGVSGRPGPVTETPLSPGITPIAREGGNTVGGHASFAASTTG